MDGRGLEGLRLNSFGESSLEEWQRAGGREGGDPERTLEGWEPALVPAGCVPLVT